MKLEVEICFLKHENKRSMKKKILNFFLKNYKRQKWASLFKTFKNVTLRNDIYLEVKIWIDPAFFRIQQR